MKCGLCGCIARDGVAIPVGSRWLVGVAGCDPLDTPWAPVLMEEQRQLLAKPSVEKAISQLTSNQRQMVTDVVNAGGHFTFVTDVSDLQGRTYDR